MTLDEMRLHAEALHEDERSWMTLVLPKGWKAPKGFPRRELLCEREDGGRAVSVNVRRLLRWIDDAEVVLGNQRARKP